jgi:esterase/lipase
VCLIDSWQGYVCFWWERKAYLRAEAPLLGRVEMSRLKPGPITKAKTTANTEDQQQQQIRKTTANTKATATANTKARQQQIAKAKTTANMKATADLVVFDLSDNT